MRAKKIIFLFCRQNILFCSHLTRAGGEHDHSPQCSKQLPVTFTDGAGHFDGRALDMLLHSAHDLLPHIIPHVLHILARLNVTPLPLLVRHFRQQRKQRDPGFPECVR